MRWSPRERGPVCFWRSRSADGGLFLHVLCKKFLRPFPGEVAGFLAIARALVAVEAVRRVRISVGFRLRLLLLDLVHDRHRNAVILLAEMHLQRAFRFLIGELADHATVKGNRRGKSGDPAGGEECSAAAHAEADAAERPRA